MNVELAVEALEACVFSPASLTAHFDRVAEALDLNMFHLTDIGDEDIRLIGSTVSTAAFTDYAQNSVHEWDTWMHSAKAQRGPARRLIFDKDVVPGDVRRRDGYYQDFCGRWDIAAHCASILQIGNRDYAFTLTRTETQGDFSIDDQIAIDRVLPVAKRTALLLHEIRKARTQGLADGLETAGRACVMIDHTGQVSLVSEAAEKLFGPDFGVRSGLLWASDSSANAALGRLAATARDLAKGAPRNIVVPRSNGRPLVAVPARVRGFGLDLLPGERIVVTLLCLDPKNSLTPELLKDVFGLTPAQTRVAMLLATEKSPEEIADLTGIRIATVRQTMKSILLKTETKRQSQLVALLSKLN
ncbi:MAG: helix-turn-helix transcriptional regulator [Hyphomonas sp.]